MNSQCGMHWRPYASSNGKAKAHLPWTTPTDCCAQHTSELEAHKAYLASMMPGSRPDIAATMEEVEIGSAVQYSESGDAPAG